MSEAKPTPGPWAATDNPAGVISDSGTIAIGCGGKIISPSNMHANMALFAEAGTVYHETKLTPRQLQEQRDALLAACKDAQHAARASSSWNVLATLEAVITEVEGKS